MRAIILKLPYKLRWKMEEHCLWTAGEAPPSTRLQLYCQFHSNPLWKHSSCSNHQIIKMEIRSHRFASTKKGVVLQLLWQFSNSNPNVKGSTSQILVVSQNGQKKIWTERKLSTQGVCFANCVTWSILLSSTFIQKKEIKSEDTQQETPENSRIVSLKTWGHIL